MLISKTPIRISFLGGGSDLPGWVLKHGGLVVGSTINKYSYVMAREYPPFHEYKTRLVYNQIEHINGIDEIEHKAIKACLDFLDYRSKGIEIIHSSDLPGRSGTGSSSTFVVGLLNAISTLKGQHLTPYELASNAIYIEQTILKENVGSQDQTFAAYGGLNKIIFHKDGDISTIPLALDQKIIEDLQSNLMLFFTKIYRTSSEISASYAPIIANKEKEEFAMMKLAELGIESIYKSDWEKLGNLIDQSWKIKSGLSSFVTNAQINEIYTTARVSGAWGGKITGAGGGGCMLFVIPLDKQEKVKSALEKLNCVNIPFRFSKIGSHIIYSDKDIN